jgi:transcriptional regulator with XRE-family HTH domain
LYYKTTNVKLLITDMNEQSKKLGANIKRILVEKNMTQGDICRKLDVDRAYISNVVSGNKNPTLATITKIAEALDVSVGELLK